MAVYACHCTAMVHRTRAKCSNHTIWPIYGNCHVFLFVKIMVTVRLLLYTHTWNVIIQLLLLFNVGKCTFMSIWILDKMIVISNNNRTNWNKILVQKHKNQYNNNQLFNRLQLNGAWHLKLMFACGRTTYSPFCFSTDADNGNDSKNIISVFLFIILTKVQTPK